MNLRLAAPRPTPDPASTGGIGAHRYAALVLAEVIIAIHVALTGPHLEEKFYIGVLFAIGNGALFAAILLLLSRRLRVWGWCLGAAVCLVEFAGFIASRTVGLPLGYHETWASAPEDYLGLISLAAEAAFLVVTATALSWQRSGTNLRIAARSQPDTAIQVSARSVRFTPETSHATASTSRRGRSN